MYVFNKSRKRLEPTETKCQFCEMESSSSMEDNYFVPLFKENDRTNVIVYRSVKYSKIPVGIPRCKSCMEIHEQAKNKGSMISWAIGIGLTVLAFMIWGSYGIFAIVVGLLIGAFGTNYFQNKLVREKAIFTQRDGAERNEAVQSLIIEGWSFNQPTA